MSKLKHMNVIARRGEAPTKQSSYVAGLPLLLRSLAMTVLLSLFITSTAYAQCSPAQDGLVAYYSFEEGSGLSTENNANPGTLDGTLTNSDGGIVWSAGRIGDYSLNFSGTDDYVSISNFYPPRAGTIAMWIQFDAATGNADRIIHAHDDYEILRNASDELQGDIFDNNGASYTSALVAGAWYYLVYTYDFDADESKLYLDNVLLDTDGASAEPLVTGPETLLLGDNGSGTQDFDGKLDEVRIYDRVLTTDEIGALYTNTSVSSSDSGVMIYDTKHDRMMYCDGTDWVHAGTGPYNPSAVNFDAANDYLYKGSTSYEDTNKFTASFWIRRVKDDASWDWIYDENNPGPSVGLKIISNGDVASDDNAGRILFNAHNAAGTQILGVDTNVIDASWHHVLASFDLSDTSKRHIYVDGVSNVDSYSAYVDDLIDRTPVTIHLAAQSSSVPEFGGDLADFWLDYGTYIDLSDEANRRKFISANGLPMYLGQDGSIPTGEAPDVFFSGDTVSFSSNRGAIGSFTPNGELTDGVSQPGDTLRFSSASPSSPVIISALVDATNVVQAYELAVDGDYLYMNSLTTNSFTVFDISDPSTPFVAGVLTDATHLSDLRNMKVSGNYVYTVSGGGDRLVVIDVSDPVNPALANTPASDTSNMDNPQDIDVKGDYAYVVSFVSNGLAVVDISDPANPSVAGSITGVTSMSGARAVAIDPNRDFAYAVAETAGSFTVFDVSDPANPVVADGGSAVLTDATDLGGSYEIKLRGDYAYVYARSNNRLTVVDVSNPTSPAIVYSLVDANINNAYAFEIAGDYAYIPSITGNRFNVVSLQDPVNPSVVSTTTSAYLNGARPVALSGRYAYVAANNNNTLTVIDVGISGSCDLPDNNAAAEGTMLYNPHFNVMQYCNGAEWVAMGPTGGTPPTNGLLAHWQFNENSGTSVADSAGSYTGTWVGGTISDTNGLVNGAFQLDGDNNWINLPDNNDLAQNRSALTVSMWLKPGVLSSESEYSQVFGLGQNSGGTASRFWVTYSDPSDLINLGVSVPDGVSQSINSAEILDKNRWTHVVGVADIANDRMAIYMDGEISFSSAVNFTPTATDNTTSARSSIGAEEDNVGYGDFAGAIDEVRVYGRALSAQEIQQLYYYGLSGGLGDVDNGCLNPAAEEGEMIYNADFNVMQYCNGEQWIGIGQ